MDQIVDWRQRISETKVDGALQTEIADKILELLEQKKESVSALDQILFGQAITGLAINICLNCQTTDAGLESCLTALRKMMALKKDTGESNAGSAESGESLACGVLVTIVEKLKKRIS